MADLDQIAAALRAADAAGNVEDAKRLAQAYAAVRGAQQPQTITPKAPDDATLARQAYDDSPFLQRAMISAGGELKALGRGLGQILTPDDSAAHKAITAAADADAPFQDAPHGAANLVGRALPYLATVPFGGPEAAILSRVPQAGRLATLAIKAGTAAAEGAGYGAAREVRTGESRGRNALVGAAGGVAGRGLAGGIGAGVRGSRNALASLRGLSNADRAAAERLLAEADDAARLSRPAPSAVPGVQRDLAEESLDPGIARLSRTVRSQPGAGFTDIDLANNAARVRALEPIAGTDADMAAAEAARSSAASGARSQAMAAGDVDVSRTVAQLDDAIDAAKGRPAVQDGLRKIRGLLAQDVEHAPGIVTTMPETNIAVLDNVRQTIGDMLSGKYGGESAAALRGSRELLAIRDSLNKEIGDQVPAFTDYLNAFRQGSGPINRMEVGRDLLSPSSGGAVQDALGNQVLTPAQFSKKARDLDAVAARATGFAKAKAADILKPTDIATIKAIQDDLERQAFRQTAGSGGNSQTFERLGVQGRIAKRGASSLLGNIPVVGRFAGDMLDALERSKNARIQERLAYLVANPEEARRVIAALNPAGQRIVSKALADLSRLATQRATTSATVTANSRPLQLDIRGGTPVPAAELDAQLSGQGY